MLKWIESSGCYLGRLWEGLRISNNDESCQQIIGSIATSEKIYIFLKWYIPFELGVIILESGFMRDIYLKDVSIVSIYNEEINFISALESY